VQIKKFGRDAIVLEEKLQKCSWCRYFCKLFLLKEINKIIDSLKSKDSSGYDEISTKIIKISKYFIISPLINRFNKVLAQGKD
jgi:hypothetical protein